MEKQKAKCSDMGTSVCSARTALNRLSLHAEDRLNKGLWQRLE